VTPELAALLEAIRANPEDDLPRLALADWCLEQADPAEQARGEFIHLRCRGAALAPDDPERARLEQRVGALREEFEARWFKGLASLDGWDFERGCVLLEVTHEWLRRHTYDRLARAAKWPWVIGLRGLLLDADDLAPITSSPHLGQLTSLHLRDCSVGAVGATALAVSPLATGLAALHLDYCGLGDRGAVALAESPHLKRLTTLGLGNNGIGKQGATAVARSPHLARVVRLDLSRNPVGDPGARALASSAQLSSLRELSLASCNLTDRSGVLLASSSRLEGLALLDLRDNRFREATREELRERFGSRVRL
jgi:uncharacterized protein (TIGR02996 family)